MNRKSNRTAEKKWVIVKPYHEQNQSEEQQLNIDFLDKKKKKKKKLNIDFPTLPSISEELIQPPLESAPKHPNSNGVDHPNQQQPHITIENIESHHHEVGLSVINNESLEEARESDDKSQDDIIRRRLEDIKLAAQEPTLSQDKLRVNDRLQEEEILAMEAIYGEDVIVLDREDGLRSFQINIHIEAPGKLIMPTKIGEIGNEAMETADDSNGFFYSSKVQYLPPIVLTCLLPTTYPSHSAPFFTISVQWLNTMRISSLCQMLDTIWMGQAGQEVVYPWVDWLHNSSLSYLEFDNEILLAPFEKADNDGDRRAISESVSLDVDIQSLLKYNDDKCYEKFCQNLHACCICLSEYTGAKFVRLPCKHFFCQHCLETYSTMQAREIMAIQCPQIKCKELVPPGLVKGLLGDEKFEQWESKLFHKTLDTMSDLVYCPRCDMACLEDTDHLAQCPKCFFTFCGLCRDRLHVGVQCITSEEKLNLLRNRQPGMKTTSQQRKELDMINQLLNEKEIKRIAKKCPNCSMAISRISGCNHMRCTKCKTEFCYKCGDAYYTGYCMNCTAFDHDTFHQVRQETRLRQERQREAQMREREAIRLQKEQLMLNQKRAEDPAYHPHPCPICRQMNAKVENNNHICCWSCQKHYCYLCRKIVQRSSQHYGPKGCKQHSAG
ncbi:hypothetical protein MKW92_050813 [Papaver armeniacum]|nr:hypothetical protein MKW92_050813 [Papaver armeniacum]